jgi:hypothetical protein
LSFGKRRLSVRKVWPARVRLADNLVLSSGLFCPYCGSNIIDLESQECVECPHVVYAGPREELDGAVVRTFRRHDLIFYYFERSYGHFRRDRKIYIVFRGPCVSVTGGDAEPGAAPDPAT